MSKQRTADAGYLTQLNEAVAQIVARPQIHSLIDTLKQELQHTTDPFVWSSIDLQSIPTPLPDNIRSCWIFVLKKDVPSGCHYHPNSVQHMVMIEGEGTSKVGGVSREMKRFDEKSSQRSLRISASSAFQDRLNAETAESRRDTQSRFRTPNSEQDGPLADTWYVIPQGVPHEFFPKGRDVVVVSFHTCDSDELEEISCDSGATRNYETR